MRYVTFVLACVFWGTAASAEDAPEWKQFTSKEGKFKVMMPGKPKEYKLDSESDFGKGVLHMNAVQVGKSFYGANYSDFPAEVKKAPLKTLYDSSRDGAIANMNGKLSSEKDIKLGDHAGREIRIDVSDGKMLFRARVFLVEQRLYQVVILGTPEVATSKEADKYFDSFQLEKK